MLEQARKDSDQIRLGALNYTNDLLSNAEAVLTASYNNSKKQYEGLLESLKGSLDVIASNRSELSQDEAAVTNEQSMEFDPPEPDDIEEFQFDENAFLDAADEEQ